MTDLEITKLCAEAMGKTIIWNDYLKLFQTGSGTNNTHHFDPLHDDAQAMALVKKFKIALGWNPGWSAFDQSKGKWVYAKDIDDRENLNFAICLCVADMQASYAAGRTSYFKREIAKRKK